MSIKSRGLPNSSRKSRTSGRTLHAKIPYGHMVTISRVEKSPCCRQTATSGRLIALYQSMPLYQHQVHARCPRRRTNAGLFSIFPGIVLNISVLLAMFAETISYLWHRLMLLLLCFCVFIFSPYVAVFRPWYPSCWERLCW